MRTTADLNRIIDKIADKTPARFDAPSPQNAEVRRTPDSAFLETRRPKTPDAEPSQELDAADGNDSSHSFASRLAADSDLLASTPTRSASTRERRRSQTPLISSDASRSPVERVKNKKNVKVPAAVAKKRDEEDSDDENKRTQRRRQIDPTTCERDYSTDEIEFMKALDDYKRASGRMFPTCSEILEVFKSLGYVKIARASSPDDALQQKKQPNRAAPPAFLNDEENDAFAFNVASVHRVA